MNNNASKIQCELLMYPTDEKYSEKIRHFQGCPTLAVTKGGRIFAGWYSGGTREPHMDNYNLLIYSDDKGKTWSHPVLVIPGNKEKFIHALDIQLWTSPEGKLYVFWVQNNTAYETDPKPENLKPNQPWVCVDGYQFPDFLHAEWVSVCDEPDAEVLSFSQPRYLDIGFLRCKPLVTKSGRWINFNYDQMSERYGYSISDNNGKSYTHLYGAEKVSTPFDEAMAYQKEDGTIRMFARTDVGYLAQSVSHDDGNTWEKAENSGIVAANSRFYVSRTPSGRVLLVLNDDSKTRCKMTAYLSEDDGETWKYKKLIDPRPDISYPDIDFHDGRIYLTYDRERTGAKEILFTSFTEDDIMDDSYEFKIDVISKA
ncbi:MAG: exo-alpha-sialidase [Ruminococcaceae bacterium]|nr:exo-alpha-sialidase [Oscillospiraceae bacterium]